MKIKDLVDYYGNQVLAAEAIGVSRQAVTNWKRRGIIPDDIQIRYHIQSRGKLPLPKKLLKRLNDHKSYWAYD